MFVPLVGFFWVATAALYSNTANIEFLTELKSCTAHTLTRFVGATLLCLSLAPITHRTRPQLQHLHLFLLPAVCMVALNVTNYIAITRIGLTLTFVVKSTIPVLTCGYCYIVKGQQFPQRVVGAVLVSCLGVCFAAAGDIRFEWTGHTSACLSLMAQCAFNTTGKNALAANGLAIKPVQGFATACIITSILTIGMYQVEWCLPGVWRFPVFTTAAHCLFGSSIVDLRPVALLVGVTSS